MRYQNILKDNIEKTRAQMTNSRKTTDFGFGDKEVKYFRRMGCITMVFGFAAAALSSLFGLGAILLILYAIKTWFF